MIYWSNPMFTFNTAYWIWRIEGKRVIVLAFIRKTTHPPTHTDTHRHTHTAHTDTYTQTHTHKHIHRHTHYFSWIKSFNTINLFFYFFLKGIVQCCWHKSSWGNIVQNVIQRLFLLKNKHPHQRHCLKKKTQLSTWLMPLQGSALRSHLSFLSAPTKYTIYSSNGIHAPLPPARMASRHFRCGESGVGWHGIVTWQLYGYNCVVSCYREKPLVPSSTLW